MEACVHCEHPTGDCATVYVGTESFTEQGVHYTYTPLTLPLCSACVRKRQSKNFSGICFYLALQLCWLTTFRYGFTPVGVFAAAVALWALYRLFIFLGRRWWQRYRSELPEPRILYRSENAAEAASDLLKELLRQDYAAKGLRVESLREYQRHARV